MQLTQSVTYRNFCKKYGAQNISHILKYIAAKGHPSQIDDEIEVDETTDIASIRHDVSQDMETYKMYIYVSNEYIYSTELLALTPDEFKLIYKPETGKHIVEPHVWLARFADT